MTGTVSGGSFKMTTSENAFIKWRETTKLSTEVMRREPPVQVALKVKVIKINQMDFCNKLLKVSCKTFQVTVGRVYGSMVERLYWNQTGYRQPTLNLTASPITRGFKVSI